MIGQAGGRFFIEGGRIFNAPKQNFDRRRKSE